MPLITVTVSTPYKTVLPRAEIADEVTRLTATLLKKDPAVTAVIVERVSPDSWFCGGRSLSDAFLASFWVDVHVTDGTNTPEQKAAFIAAIFGAMEELLGPLHEESYVHVHEVRADAYGYGGLTQAQRARARRQLKVPVAAAL
ncbi:MAG TPA: 4-oxalocrotonate tautomerase family protein [Pseudolabrys sp.]|nr:4-oxalocrotonate tautomerase family protein [Pseudolabrys sp.]